MILNMWSDKINSIVARLRHNVSAPESSRSASNQQILDHFSLHIREPEIPALEAICQLGVIESKQVKQRCVKIVDVDSVFHHLEAELIRLAHGDARFDAAASQPDRERLRMMIAAKFAARI